MIHTEIHTLEALKARLVSGKSFCGVVLQGFDVSPMAETLLPLELKGLIVLGCTLPMGIAAKFVQKGVVIFPKISGLPYEPYRNALYSAADLFHGFDAAHPKSYALTPDAKIYTHFMAHGRGAPDDIVEALAQRLHDFSITDAVGEYLAARDVTRCVAIMGGHNLGRDERAYTDVAKIARTLTRDGYRVLSGGGPGAMEATHLGAGLSEGRDEALHKAVAILSAAPHYKDEFWLSKAFEVLERFDFTDSGLAIPTWLYGHEPPTPFASAIAKYFSNSTREDGLITHAAGGIIFAPGNAGTIQEIFQDLAQNHYATTGQRSPMVFLGHDYWHNVRPVYPVVESYVRDEPYAPMIICVDSPDEAVAFIKNTPPIPV